VKGGSTVVLDIQADEATYASNLPQSLVIDSAGNLHFANEGMVFDRLNQRLGLSTSTPTFKVDAVGGGIRLRNNETGTARTIELRTNLTTTTTDVSALNADLAIRAGTTDDARDIFMMSRRVGVGVGTTVPPDAKLHVIGQTPPQFIVENNAGNARMDFRRSASNGVSQLLFGTGPLSGGTLDYQIGMFLDSVFQIRVTNDSTKGIALTTGGNVGIGKTAPAAKLDVAGVVNASGGYTNISDMRLKENVSPISGALDKVIGVKGVSFTWKRDGDRSREFPEGRHYGVVAQQVEEVMPEVVRTAPGGEKAVSYTEMVPVLIEAIKEQQKTLEEQQKVIDQLREEIAAIRMESRMKGKVAATSFTR
jgi:trimeric autotransporter adhesin